MTSSAVPNVDLYDAYFRRADLDGDGRISGVEAVSFFRGSGLSNHILAQIWSFASTSQSDFLSRAEFYNALKLNNICYTPTCTCTCTTCNLGLRGPVPNQNLHAASGARLARGISPVTTQEGLGLALTTSGLNVATPTPTQSKYPSSATKPPSDTTFVIFFFIFFLLLLLGGVLSFQIIYQCSVNLKINYLVVLFIMVPMIVLLPLVTYLLVNLSFVKIIVVVESRWGFEPLRRSLKLVKGLKRLVLSTFLLFGFLEVILMAISGYSLVQFLVISPILAILMLFNILVTTVRAVHALQGEAW